MQKEEKENLTERKRMLEILGKRQSPVSARELGTRLRLAKVRLSNYQVVAHLRALQKEGDAIQEGVKWRTANARGLNEGTAQGISRLFSPVALPDLSTQTILQLERPGLAKEASEKKSSEKHIEGSWWDTERIEEPRIDFSGRWTLFRKLISYYRQCIRNEEGAEAMAYQNQIGERYVYLRKNGPWYPRNGFSWQTSILIGEHISGLVNNLPGPSDENALVVGYPIYAYFREREGEPDLSLISPIFHFPVEYSIVRGGLLIRSEKVKAEVNLNWLEYAFKNNPSKKSVFLSACGFINRSRPNDEMPGLERGEESPNFETLSSALKALMSEKIIEALELSSITDVPIKEPFQSGIYNRAVLMLAKKTRFSATLLKELSVIEKAPEKELDQTALKMVFVPEEVVGENLQDLVHEETVVDTTRLNAEQRLAVASFLKRPLTVVTGPPGTGKSQVVSAAAANARLQNQSVLFASRNHKAIDAVYNRFVDIDDRPLMIRTNSKEDPNLNFTFADAAKQMLRDQFDPDSEQRFKNVEDEISNLLRNRGETARIARKCSLLGTTLGELEERMGYLGRALPLGMASFIEAKPSLFPGSSIRRIAGASKILALKDEGQSIVEKMNCFFRRLFLFPHQLVAKRRLRSVPGCPEIASCPTRHGLEALIRHLPMLEKAAEYSRLRLKCIPLEEEIRKLPPLEKLTDSISETTKRLEKIAPRAIKLDADRRRGMPPVADREEMAGLGTSLRAMRTGVDEGRIRKKVLQALNKSTPFVLKSFPCWAVTNLSAGSRIPLMAGIFDLVIVDEASQSDIPSAIPLLFRAKRAGVVGDPFQLTHCSKLTASKDTMLRREVGINRVEDMRFSYSEHSLYDLFASTNGVEPVFLSETYRSASEIAAYSNDSFYNGRLRVATDLNRLKMPKGAKPGIHWTEINGDVQSGGGRGCFCKDEVEAVVQIVRSMLIDNDFLGNIGIVTPFRQQANRIRDALYESDADLYKALVAAQTHIDTAHGFQGDERDVIIFSLCAGAEMPNGSRGFLRENPNLFNVAASRARALLHVVGNREWALRSSIPHIERLASPPRKDVKGLRRGPWHPHESPWEKILFDALVAEGLDPRPQFPVANRRLDMALIKEGGRSLKMDIEVDGDCHRNPDGSRKLDDVWRDMQLQSLGWKVFRFWTYKLREDLTGSVKTIMETWSGHE